MFKNWTYKEAQAHARAIKELGMADDIYLSDGAEFPWHIATSLSEGGSHRLEISTDVWFSGKDPKTELTYRWSFDIEPRSANGSGTYHIDVMAVKEVMAKLSPELKVKFQKYLNDCAAKIEKQAKELLKTATEEKGVASLLREASAIDGLQKAAK